MYQLLYLLSLLLLAKTTVGFLHCPNGQQPKKDFNGILIQCLPGSAFSEICGENYGCFFSGVNYMCCPKNEPSATNQPTCPAPLQNVLDKNRKPLKCSRTTRRCPSKHMSCLDVGIDFVCCEQPILHSNAKKTPKNKLNVCPSGSKRMLNSSGKAMHCSSDYLCNKKEQFCFGRTKICCETMPENSTEENSVVETGPISKSSMRRVTKTKKMRAPIGWIGFTV